MQASSATQSPNHNIKQNHHKNKQFIINNKQTK